MSQSALSVRAIGTAAIAPDYTARQHSEMAKHVHKLLGGVGEVGGWLKGPLHPPVTSGSTANLLAYPLDRAFCATDRTPMQGTITDQQVATFRREAHTWLVSTVSR